jgi:hypothetical protein
MEKHGQISLIESSHLFSQVLATIQARYEKFGRKSLFDAASLDEDFFEIEPQVIRLFSENRTQMAALLADECAFNLLLGQFVTATLDFTYRCNQFLHFDNLETAYLVSIYRKYLNGMRSVLAVSRDSGEMERELSGLVRKHFGDLKRNLERIEGRRENPFLYDKVVCEDYSPELQLKILGLRVVDLQPPVLDLGCGRQGSLTAYLRRQGVETVGVDRIVEDEDYLRVGNWLELDLEPESWGTILSHMAFSNHFAFQHQYTRGKAERYARQYMVIVNALKPGGRFCYAPNLPFMEDLLPGEKYAVKRLETGLVGWYACQVQRRGRFSP